MSVNVAKIWTFIRTARYSTLCPRREAIANKNSRINAFVNISPAPPPLPDKNLQLGGLTVAVKDNIATRSLPTTCSSAMLRGFTSPFDATVVSLLQDSGADVIGKTNCDEFGMGSLNIHSCHGPVWNPVNQDCATDSLEARSAGGSSGGSAAAVAAGLCDAALGTDTGGSVRLPASYCGVVGLKPSYGLISRWGVVSYADSLDCVGILASDVDTTERIFHTLAVFDALDPTAAPLGLRKEVYQSTEKRLSSINFAKSNSLEGLRVGIPQEYFPSELSTEIIQQLRNVVSELRLRGAMIIPISLPSTSYALSSYYVLASAEASSNLARYDGVQYGSYVKPPPGTDITKTSNVYAQSRTAGFGEEVQKRILLGTYALSADAFDNYFLQAQRVRQLIKEDFNHVFAIPNHYSDSPVMTSSKSPKVDVLLHPSAIRTAPLLNEVSSGASDLSPYVQDVLTVPASLAGLPALSVPVKDSDRESERWPVGISVVGQWGTDEMVLAIGKVVQDLYRES